MKKSTLLLKDICLNPSQIHKFRGFIGNLFRDYDMLHNHDPITGKLIYRYPLIQFKLINGIPAIIAVTDKAVELFSLLFLKLNEVVIEDLKIPVFEKDLYIEDVTIRYANETFMYEFMSPWLALNQKNFRRYTESESKSEKANILRQTLIGNILSMSKGLGYTVPAPVEASIIEMKEVPARLKGTPMLGFLGTFSVNFEIPDYWGIGKSVSRGIGTVIRCFRLRKLECFGVCARNMGV